jgi:DNA-binding response OmpR family regulator
MERNLRRLVSLINEMIEFSRMEIRGVQLKKTLFNAGKLVRECVASVQPQGLAKDVSVSIFVPDDFPPVWGDREKIGQVLGILLSNAVKFSHAGGMIQVRVSEDPNHTLSISVSDTGIGIDPALHARVFEKFFQVDGSMTRRYEGTGIGLSIAHSVVEAHGGEIVLESELNKGSTFTTLLPGAVFDSTVSARSAEGCRHLRVLAVVEGEAFRKAVSAVLTQSGCTVVEAANGYECARLAEEMRPDAIVFDEILADAAGVNAVSQIRQHPETSAIPIIGLSGEDVSKVQGMGGLLHGVHFVFKPFSAEDLMTHIRQVCLGEADSATVHAAETPRKGLSALIVDSDSDLLEWITMGLERRAISCHGALDATEGVAYATRNRPEVILIDLDAPSPGPQRSLSVFRENEATRDIPVCVMSGFPSRETGLPEGAAMTLRKPFSIDELVRVIEELRPHSVV